MQNGLFGNVTEVDFRETNVALERRIGQSAVAVGMLPSPKVGACLAFDKIAVFIICRVDEGNVAFVALGLFVEKLEDTGCARERHRDRVDVLSRLVDVHTELTGHIEERSNDGDLKESAVDGVCDAALQKERTANEYDENVEDITDVAEDRT